MHRLLACLSVVVFAYGCTGNDTPLAPSSTAVVATVPVAPPPTPQPDSGRVIGRVVDSANGPVAGARVTQWDTSHTAISDASGTFDLTISIKPLDRTFWVTVEKVGYETSELPRSVENAATTLLRLHQIRTIAAGGSVHLALNPDDSACGYHWGFVCRTVRVRPQSSGTLTLEVLSDGATGIGIPVGPSGFPQRLEQRISIPVRAGSEVSVEVATGEPVGSSVGFTVNTSLTSAS